MLNELDSGFHLREKAYRFANNFHPIAQLIGKIEFKKNIQPIADSINKSILIKGSQFRILADDSKTIRESPHVLNLPVINLDGSPNQIHLSLADYSTFRHNKGLLHITCPINQKSPGLVIKYDLEGNILEYTEIFPNKDQSARYEYIYNGTLTDFGKACGTLATVLRCKDSLSFIQELVTKQKS